MALTLLSTLEFGFGADVAMVLFDIFYKVILFKLSIKPILVPSNGDIIKSAFFIDDFNSNKNFKN